MDYFRVHLAKEAFKFSSTHFTLFSATEAERLHGHNYQVSVECGFEKLDEFGMGFEFNELKPHIKALTEAWDERVLIPGLSPHLKVSTENIREKNHLIVEFGTRSYRFPETDVIILEAVNVTSEELARLFALALAKAWQTATARKNSNLANRIHFLEISIEETRGQRASFKLISPLERSDLA